METTPPTQRGDAKACVSHRCKGKTNTNHTSSLKADTSRQCGSARQYTCTDLKGTESASFVFYYREPGTCDKINERDVDVITDDHKGVDRTSRSSTSRPRDESPVRQWPRNVVTTPQSFSRRVINHEHPSAREQETDPSTEEWSLFTVAAGSTVDGLTSKSLGSEESADSDYATSVEKIMLNDRLIEISRQERIKEKQALVRVRREEIRDETRDLNRQMEQLQQRRHKLRIEDSDLSIKDQQLEMQLQGNGQQDSEDGSDEEYRQEHTAFKEAMQRLLDCQHNRLKRRRIS